jgi:hypothetical protein
MRSGVTKLGRQVRKNHNARRGDITVLTADKSAAIVLMMFSDGQSPHDAIAILIMRLRVICVKYTYLCILVFTLTTSR